MKILPPGADVVPVPAPVDDEPPVDRFCDLVMTGGVASGVVYPWAVVELARAYRFRSIGGTSVGAMAAALAAAAEYGRRTSLPGSFETLRRLPASLAERLDDGRTRMLSLFQPSAAGKRLFDLIVLCLRKQYPEDGGPPGEQGRVTWWRIIVATLRAYLHEILVAAAVVALAHLLLMCVPASGCAFVSHCAPVTVGLSALVVLEIGFALRFGRTVALVLGAVAIVSAVLWMIGAGLCAPSWRPGAQALWSIAISALVIGVAAGTAFGIWFDVRRGIVANDLGLCKGGNPAQDDDDRPALTTWLHQGIQLSAGLAQDGPPLTFRNLWEAPASPGERYVRAPDDAAPRERSINLEVITTNVSLGRPFRLPLVGETTRLFFRLDELEDFFPASVLAHLEKKARPYAPARKGDPSAADGAGYLELPGADLPIVVAARLSLSFPLLFSAVPLYAIQPARSLSPARLRRCWFSDGGISSNFPIHLFDTAVPRWPTFGMWLGTRQTNPHGEAVYLPDDVDQGGDSFWVGTGIDGVGPKSDTSAGRLFDFLAGAVTTAKDWSDIATMRLPHMRCRIARLGLRQNEGALNIAMPGRQILRMAAEYGTTAGRLFRARYEARDDDEPTDSWSEQRWVRFQVIKRALHDFVRGLANAADAAPLSVPLDDAFEQSTSEPPLRASRGLPRPKTLSKPQAKALERILQGLRDLESVLDANDVPQPDPLQPVAEIRSRPPL
jgi:predicted acylesterase/phospholipase RssA